MQSFIISAPRANITRVVKSRRTRWLGHKARMRMKRNAKIILVGRPKGMRPLGRHKHRECNIKMDGLDWIHPARDRKQGRDLCKVMNLRVHKMWEIYSVGECLFIFSRMSLVHGVNHVSKGWVTFPQFCNQSRVNKTVQYKSLRITVVLALSHFNRWQQRIFRRGMTRGWS